jgi:hypothetical protein
MIMYPARPVINDMRSNDAENGRDKQQWLVVRKEQLGNKENKAYRENSHRPIAMVVALPTVVQREKANAKSKDDHADFEAKVFDDIDAENRQAG